MAFTFLQSENVEALAKALAQAQGELVEAGKTSFNPGFKSKYADLAEVLQTIRPVSSRNGISFVQGLTYSDGHVGVTTRLMHTSGQWLESHLDVPITKKDPQGVGSGATYGRRYSLASMFGISQDDDDGNDASSVPKKPAAKKAESQTGTSTSNQVPPETTEIARAMIVSLKSVGTGMTSLGSDEVRMKSLTDEYASLTLAEQNMVLPEAKAARARLTKLAMG